MSLNKLSKITNIIIDVGEFIEINIYSLNLPLIQLPLIHLSFITNSRKIMLKTHHIQCRLSVRLTNVIYTDITNCTFNIAQKRNKNSFHQTLKTLLLLTLIRKRNYVITATKKNLELSIYSSKTCRGVPGPFSA